MPKNDRRNVGTERGAMARRQRKKRKCRPMKEKEMIGIPTRPKVLIVESNDTMADAFQTRLQEAGFDARTTWSGHAVAS